MENGHHFFWIIKFIFKSLVSRFRPKIDTIYFVNVWGKYNDSTYYLAKSFCEEYKNVTFYYQTDNSYDTFPSNLIPVKTNSKLDLKLLTRSQIVIDNNTGYYWSKAKPKSLRLLLLKILCRLHSNINISLWHGSPLKKLFSDIPSSETKKYVSTTDIFCLSDTTLLNVIKRNFVNRSEYYVTGLPRNDILYQNNKCFFITTKNDLGFCNNTRYILYAPTFRDTNNSFFSTIDFDKICESFERKFGGSWGVVVRTHPSLKLTDSFHNSYTHSIVDGNANEDIGPYLAFCDSLITDYSGSLFDCLGTSKPCFLYMVDFDDYCQKRGIYYELSDLPYPISFSFEQLLDDIDGYDSKSSLISRHLFKTKIGNIDNGFNIENFKKILIDKHIWKYDTKKN